MSGAAAGFGPHHPHEPTPRQAKDVVAFEQEIGGVLSGGRIDRPKPIAQLLTANINLRADLLVDLAVVLAAGGDRQAATGVVREALGLYERKGNLVSAARARSFAA